MKVFNFQPFSQASLLLILTFCFLQPALGLECYTCDSFIGVDGDTSSFDRSCEAGVPESTHLLKPCDEPGPGEESVCVMQRYKAYPWESKLAMFSRSCLNVRKSGRDNIEVCVSKLPRQILKTSDRKAMGPKLFRVLLRSQAPWHVCFCNQDECNDNDSSEFDAIANSKKKDKANGYDDYTN